MNKEEQSGGTVDSTESPDQGLYYPALDYQLGWTVFAASRLLDTLKCIFHFMFQKFSHPYMLHNIKGT